jgi:hypothetical protein
MDVERRCETARGSLEVGVIVIEKGPERSNSAATGRAPYHDFPYPRQGPLSLHARADDAGKIGESGVVTVR